MGARTNTRANGRRMVLAGALMMTTALGGALLASPAYARDGSVAARPAALDADVSVNIPAQPLATALTLLGQQTGLQITVHGALVRDMSAPEVRGQMTGEQAFARLLSGTDLTYVVAPDGTVAIQSRGGQTADGAFQLSPVRVQGNADSGPAEPGSITIGSKTLERLGAQDLQDVFKTTPGVQVGSSLPISQKVYVNGIEETNLSVTIDGARQSNKLFHHSTTNYIDPSLFKAVRIDPGVAPADAGPGALAGAIAYETKDVTDLLAPGDGFGGVVGSKYITNGDVFSKDITLFGRHSGFEALGYFRHADGNGFEDGNGNSVLGSGTGIESGLAKLGYQHESGYRIEGSFERVIDDETRPRRANFVSTPTATAPYRIERENIVASFENATPEGLFNLYGRIAKSTTDLDASIPYETHGYTESVSGMIANEAHFQLGTVNAGVDFYADSARGFFPTFGEDNTEKADNVGLFVQARLEPADWARISFGGRADFHEFEGIRGQKSENDGLSGNISGEFDVLPALTVSGGYSHVFGGVALAEPYIFNPGWAYPNGGMKPSTADNVFAGLTINGEGIDPDMAGITVSGKVFRTELDNVRDEEFGRGPNVFSDVDSDGFEVAARYNWDLGLVGIAFADIDTEINGLPANSSTGQYLATPIGEVLTLEAVHTLASTGVTLGADAQFVFEQQGYFNGAPTRKMSAYEVVNAFVSYNPPMLDQLTLRAEVSNLFDEFYADRSTFGGDFAGTTQLNEPGRSFGLSARFSF